LDHCFIMTHSIHKEGDILQSYFCVIFRETRYHTQAHITSDALCPFFGHEKNTDSRAVWVDFAGHFFVMATSAEACCCCCCCCCYCCCSPLPPPQNSLTSLAFAPDSKPVSATRISLLASSLRFIYIFPAIARDP